MTYPDLAALKTFLGTSGSGDDTPLAKALNGAIADIERRTGRVFVVAADSAKTFPVRKPYVSKDWLTLTLFRDLATITTITNGSGVAVAAASYDLWPQDAPYAQIILRPESGVRWQSDGSGTPISITGKWGFSAACPDGLFEIILELAATYYRGRGSGMVGQLPGITSRAGTAESSDIARSLDRRLGWYKRGKL